MRCMYCVWNEEIMCGMRCMYYVSVWDDVWDEMTCVMTEGSIGLL